MDSIRSKFEKVGSGFEFVDMRAGMQKIPEEEAAIGGEGRALIDWNKRNLVSVQSPFAKIPISLILLVTSFVQLVVDQIEVFGRKFSIRILRSFLIVY